MNARALDPADRRVGPLAAALLLSLFAHLGAASGAARIPERPPKGPSWVEMAVVEPPPPPPPPPPPEAEPPPPPPPPQANAPPPPSDAPPPDVPPPPRIVQGLSAGSFAPGSGTGLAVRAGTTTAARAEGTGLSLDAPAAPTPVAWAALSAQPKLRAKPALVVPQEVIDAGLAGEVELLLDLAVDGRVANVRVVTSLSPAADAACIAALRSSSWKPGLVDGRPSPTIGVPYGCKFEKVTP